MVRQSSPVKMRARLQVVAGVASTERFNVSLDQEFSSALNAGTSTDNAVLSFSAKSCVYLLTTSNPSSESVCVGRSPLESIA